MQTSTFKTSTIFVSTGKRTRVFQSIDEVPSDLRRRLSENLSGPNTRTLIVADRRGREYLLKVLQRATNGTSPVPITGNTAVEAKKGRFGQIIPAAKRYWLETALICFLAATGWALFSLR